MRKSFFAAACFIASFVFGQNAVANQDVLTQHNDPARTGAQLSETILTPANVTPNTFGRLYERHVDGQIISQPLYVSGLSIPGHGTRNVVYVATRKNLVYAFDADDTDTDPTHGLLWVTSMPIEPAGRPAPNPLPMCGETAGPVGITSTPVIDRASQTMYVVARNADTNIWLHAIDITTGAPKAGTPGRMQVGLNLPPNDQPFKASLMLNRAGLLLQNGFVYIAFSALNCDNQGWRGWVIAHRTSDLQEASAFITAPDAASPGAGIWQSGNGLVGDGSHVFFATGNRQFGAPAGSALDQSFLRLATGPAPNFNLTLSGRYTVNNREALNNGDTDLGSGGPLLLPGNRLVGGGKQGKLYVLDSNTMNPTQNPPSGPVVPGGSDGIQAFVNSWHDDPSEVVCTDAIMVNRHCFMQHPRYEDSEANGPNIHTGPIFWAGANPAYGLLYAMPEKDKLRAFRYHDATHQLDTTAFLTSAVRSPDGMPGTFLSLSANGNTNGIIWALIPKDDGQWQSVPGRLAAFDALTLKELWSDDDDIAFAKFNPPTVAGGKVFRPTFADKLVVYGLKTQTTQIPCYNIAQKYENYMGTDGVLGNATSAETTAPDGIGHFRHFQGGSIYWTPTTCAQEIHGAIVQLWAAIGWEKGPLGYPLTDQAVTADGIGRYNQFQNGSIYWTPLVGAHEVHGAIRDKWVSLGAEGGALGYPVSDQTAEIDGSGQFNLFEHGSIHWNAPSQGVTVRSDPTLLIGPMMANMDRPGSDIANFSLPAANPALCQQRCADEAACRSWTYGVPGTSGAQAHCWLKDAMPLQNASNCCTSGLKIDIAPSNMRAMEGTFDRPGADFISFDLPDDDPRLCRAECGNNAACFAWTYIEPAGATKTAPARAPHCWLKNAPAAQVNNDATVSGVKAQGVGSIWRFGGNACDGASCPSWTPLDLNTASVAIAAGGGILYQLHNDGSIWKSTGGACNGVACPGWQQVDNNAVSVAIAAGTGQLYQLHADGSIWQYTNQVCTTPTACPGWNPIDKNTKSIAIVAAGSQLYQLHSDASIWKFTNAVCTADDVCPGWQQIDGNSSSVAIAAGGNNVYQLHGDGSIWIYTNRPCDGPTNCPGWNKLDKNPKTVAIAASGDKLYQLHNDGWIWQYPGGTCNGDNCPNWPRLDNNAATVAIVAGGDKLYQMHADGSLWLSTNVACDGDACPGWHQIDNNWGTSLTAADENNLYQLHGDPLYQRHTDGSIWRYTGPECLGDGCGGWQQLDKNSISTAIASDDHLAFQLHSDGTLWRYTGQPCGTACGGWLQLDKNGATVRIAAAGHQVFQLQNDGSIWRSTGVPCNGQNCGGWEKLDQNPSATAIAAGSSRVYQLHGDGSIWRSTGVPCASATSCPGWEQLDKNPTAQAIAAGGERVFQLHRDGSIWRSTGVPCDGATCSGWQQLDNNASAIAIAASYDRVFQLHSDGSIWRSTGAPCTSATSCPGWEKLDSNPDAIEIIASGRDVYQRHRNGKIWKFTGAICSGASCPGWVMLDNNAGTIEIGASEP